MSYTVHAEKPNGDTTTTEVEEIDEAKERKRHAEALGMDAEILRPDGEGELEVVDEDDLRTDGTGEVEPVDAADYELPERAVDEDPIKWVPEDFIDVIDGTPAINRKGFEVLSHFYDVDVDPTLQVPPEETGHEYCRVRCVATMPDGREVASFGSAHVDRGDEPEHLLELADTRARKRALSIATGVGAVAVAELKSGGEVVEDA